MEQRRPRSLAGGLCLRLFAPCTAHHSVLGERATLSLSRGRRVAEPSFSEWRMLACKGVIGGARYQPPFLPPRLRRAVMPETAERATRCGVRGGLHPSDCRSWHTGHLPIICTSNEILPTDPQLEVRLWRCRLLAAGIHVLGQEI